MSSTTKRIISRRQFAATTALGALSAAIVPSRVLGAQAPSNRLNIAGIGIGGMGASNLKACAAAGENIVALCDVDRDYAAKTIALYPKAAVYTDYREMLEKEKGIDAVVIATPDHTHATITLAALQAGKHVYCQKPLTHTVSEARMITEAARRHKVQTQMGNQGHSMESMRLLKEWLDDGAIGNVTEVHAWTDRPVGGDPWSDFAVQARPSDTPPVPKTLDWDKWLGPVPFRPYHPAYHPLKWRAWLDFGTGPLGDMGCHILDPAFWALELGPPQSVEATSTHYDPAVASETYPRASIVRYAFPARGIRPPVKLTWYDGRLLPPLPPELEPGRPLPGSGALLIGDKGTILHGSHGADGVRLIPETRMQKYKRPPKTLRRVTGGHESDWIRACKEGPKGVPPCSTFEYGGALTEMVLLGVLAIRMKDQRLEWDSQSLRFTNNESANELLRIQYREGWTL
ncbi:MAG TPA: Gfo/Idh/MocA family oxidoreductase [Vicinamibacterales bacterium]|nr:Gfo/Idh/MocA family oxidoreductase [Vicinamibacterales bacterium]